MRSIVLAIPPVLRVSQPDTGVLSLAGYLHSQGIDVSLVDTNLIFFESMLSSSSLFACVDALEQTGVPRSKLHAGRRIARNITKNLAKLREAKTYQTMASYKTAVGHLNEALKFVSSLRDESILLSDFRHPQLSPLRSEDLALIGREPERLSTYPYLLEGARQILRQNPDVIGISFTYLAQALQGVALAGILRREGFRGMLVLGGALLASWSAHLNKNSPFFEVWDAIVLGPGEEALHALLTEGKLERAPGLLYPKEKVWNSKWQQQRPPVCFDPLTEGIHWQNYLAPMPILPMTTTRGCYWKKCAFCLRQLVTVKFIGKLK